MNHYSASDLESPSLEWLQSYPFNIEPGVDSTTGYVPPTSTQSWRPPLGLSSYDFSLDEVIAATQKRSPVSNALSHSSLHGVSPTPSRFPSISSVQSSPHASPTSIDPILREDISSEPVKRALPTQAGRRHAPSGSKRPREEPNQPPPRNVKLDEENRYLVYLRDQQRMPWKAISRKFEQTFQRPYQAPALQMRYGRLKNRLHPWTDADTSALQMAQEYYVNKRFEIISEKMLEFGASDAWAPRVCARKLKQLEKEGSILPGSPTLSHCSEEEMKYSLDQEGQAGKSAPPQLDGAAVWSIS